MPNKLRLTDSSNADRLIELHGTDIRYCHDQKRWFIFNGRIWEPDLTGQIINMAREVAKSYEADAQPFDISSKTYSAFISHARKSENLDKLKAMISLAQCHPDIVVSSKDFDRNPDLLCVTNGVVDLTDCTFRPFNRADYITCMANVAYCRGTRNLKWESFVNEIIPDPETRRYVQKAVGYSVTGHTYEEKLFILLGNGQNGKTTFMSTLLNMLGDYASQAAESLITRKRSSGPSNELLVLMAKRFVLAAETQEDAKLDEQKVKQLTGMNRISTNPKYMSQIEFQPTWKIWLETNHEPEISGTDRAIWRRPVKIPFYVEVSKPDPYLKVDLLNNIEGRSGILNWVLEGVKMWRKDRLRLTPSLESALHTYRYNQDITMQFLNERCIRGMNLMIGKQALYEAYKRYCKTINETPRSKNAFGRQLRDHGLEEIRNTNLRFWSGISLNTKVSLHPVEYEANEC